MSSHLSNSLSFVRRISSNFVFNATYYILKSLKRVRHANFPLILAFFSCLIIYLRAMSGAGYDEELYGPLDSSLPPKNQSPLSRWTNYAQEGLSRVSEIPVVLWRCSGDLDTEDGSIRDWCLEKRFGPLQQGTKLFGSVKIVKESGSLNGPVDAGNSVEKTMPVIAVHGGAGYHEAKDEREVKRALRLACLQAQKHLSDHGSSCGAVEHAVRVLEDNEQLNAGYGSNLTIDGSVECDASIMDGESGKFGSVGAIAGVKNPISLARAILDNISQPHRLGLVPPLTLTGHGAHSFASSRGLQLVDPSEQISPRAKEDWSRWLSKLQKSDISSHVVLCRTPLQDTVGAVACDNEDRLAAAVSSGGLLLKYPGRIGEAAVFGAGCWASQNMACSVSGTGEQIILSSLARSLADGFRSASGDDTHYVLQRIMEEFYDKCKSRGDDEANAGILLLTQEKKDDGIKACKLWCAFTTASMAIAYSTAVDSKPTALILHNSRSAGAAQNDLPMCITAFSLI